MSATARSFSTVCARCDGAMVAKPNAVGVIRLRCPRCDGVSAPQARHPDDAMIPQGLVHLVGTLPRVNPGQLRCQECAHGVDGDARFCPTCQRQHYSTGAQRRTFAAKACLRCDNSFTPTGPRALYCEACR